jgi:DNA-binding MarR family transcriptional regulator
MTAHALRHSGQARQVAGVRLITRASRLSGTLSGNLAGILPGGSRGYQVLVAVDAGPPPSQLALAQLLLGIDRTAMTYLVDELEAAGLVTRQLHPADRRVRHVVATPAGRTALAVVLRALRSVEERLLSVLDPAETAQLRALLVRVARSTDEAESCATTPGS